ncbi:anaerobic C4-dicarboxylate transporter family protein [Vibrio metschnikovii]
MLQVAEKLLRRSPKQVTMIAPLVTYTMTSSAWNGSCGLLRLCRSLAMSH